MGILVLPMMSCKKMVETQPYSLFTTSNFFSNTSEAYLATLGVYEVMRKPGTYGWYIPMVYDNDSDIQYIGSGVTPDWRTIPHYLSISQTPGLYDTWSLFYSGIDRANVVIEKIPQMSQYTNGSASEKADLNRMLGEAKFLRGFYYSELVKFWGDVPFKIKSSQTGDNLNLPLTDRYIIYAQIIKDIKEAAEVLPAEKPKDERINKWGAKAILARIALAAGGYSLRADGTAQRPSDYLEYYRLAQSQINEIMASNPYKLNASYTQVFKNQSAQVFEPTESIFEVSFYTTLATTTNDSSIGYFNGPLTTAGVYPSTLNRCFVSKAFYSTFKTGDTRRDFSIARYSLDAVGNRVALLTGRQDETWTPAKWSREYQLNTATEKTYTNINYVVMRYADLLLMRAEVENELNNGPNTIAYDAINEVRRRAFGNTLTGSRIALNITAGGTGYTTVPIIKITGGGGTDASAVATIASGRISAITMLNEGTGYTSAPIVTITGVGTGATITASLVVNLPLSQIDLAAGLTKDTFLKAVQDERAWELCFEGNRKADLVRWNILGAKIASTQTELRAIRSNYAYTAGDNFVVGKHELFPLPQNELDVNRAITRQNPKY